MVPSGYRMEDLRYDKGKKCTANDCGEIFLNLDCRSRVRSGRHATADRRLRAGPPELDCDRQESSGGRRLQQAAVG